MSTHYCLDAVTIEGGKVQKIEDPAASYFTYNSSISEILWPVLENMNVPHGEYPFPWFESPSMYDGHDASLPGPEHCLKPHDVLQDIHWIEREIARHPRRYPAVWSFLVPSESRGAPVARGKVEGYYNGRKVVLYGEGKDCWAKETSPGPREGIHHRLTKEGVVRITLKPDGAPVEVRIRRGAMTGEYPEVMGGLKRVCAFAVQKNALVLAQYVH
jgi:hypothetical protein